MSYQVWSVVFGEQPSAAKWNILGTNDASFHDGTGFGSGIIFPNHITSGQSSSTWAWQAWTPTTTSYTLGSGGTADYSYTQIGKLVAFRCNITFGSGGGLTGSATWSLPVTAKTYNSAHNATPIGVAGLVAAATTAWGMTRLIDTGTFDMFGLRADGTYAANQANDSTHPGTWASGSMIWMHGFYEAA